jgi:CBS-domain-containing membrane protein
MTEYRIRSILRNDAPVLSPGTPIRRAAAVLMDADAAAAVVVGDDGRIVGILSQKDSTPQNGPRVHDPHTGPAPP